MVIFMSGIRYNGSFLRGLNIIDDFITFDKERSALLIVGVQHDFTFSATATISISRLGTFVLLVYYPLPRIYLSRPMIGIFFCEVTNYC